MGVIDGQGQVAVYTYDEVDNLLAIQRFTTTGAGVGLFAVAPGSARVNTAVTIHGFGFTAPPSSNQVSFNGVAVTVLSATGTKPGRARAGWRIHGSCYGDEYGRYRHQFLGVHRADSARHCERHAQ